MEDCVDQTIAAALPDFGDHAEESGEVFTLDIDQIPKSLEKDDKSVKMLVRTHGLSVMREERRHFWIGYYKKKETEENQTANKNLYWETVNTLFQCKDLPKGNIELPSFLDANHCPSFCLTPVGRKSVERILSCFGYNSPDIQYCPALFPVTAILRHYIPEDDCYGLITYMVSKRNPKYFSTSSLQHEVDWRVLAEVQKQYNKKVLAYLTAESGQEEVEQVLREWIWFILECLPLPHLVRVIDCFLVEGQKVLFRISLTLLRYFFKNLKSSQDWRNKLKANGLKETFTNFCQDLAVAPHIMLDRGYRFRGFSKSTIQKCSLAIEVDLKAKGFKVHASNNDNNVNVPENVNSSDVLTSNQFITIWKWLPARITSVTPTLAYSSNIHGISLTTFYGRSEPFEQTILVVKTTNNEIFGAYCSASWAERNFKDDKGLRQSYFGTGETFLFKFGNKKDGSEAKKYSWVNLNNDKKNVAGAAGDAGLSKAEEHARELFMSGQHDMISVGGGGGNAIYIDKTMTFGKTEKCHTFNNDPLCSEGDFKIAILEVYGLTKIDF